MYKAIDLKFCTIYFTGRIFVLITTNIDFKFNVHLLGGPESTELFPVFLFSF